MTKEIDSHNGFFLVNKPVKLKQLYTTTSSSKSALSSSSSRTLANQDQLEPRGHFF